MVTGRVVVITSVGPPDFGAVVFEASQAADFMSPASSIPSLNLTPQMAFGNGFSAQSPTALRRRHHQFERHSQPSQPSPRGDGGKEIARTPGGRD